MSDPEVVPADGLVAAGLEVDDAHLRLGVPQDVAAGEVEVGGLRLLRREGFQLVKCLVEHVRLARSRGWVVSVGWARMYVARSAPKAVRTVRGVVVWKRASRAPARS
ncbi:hypothetical protein ACFVWY_32905 [Streptomyces sp. NPDC058195]|uniref:hypothetical protein n=1 Tax=Streptomyces sp. NPDC058195 TaxID=3346375 RepID=UPI0036EA7BBD